ncbi:unnamed protein product [Rotaria socialis]|uniref:RING-type domain-containing protein n=1 Tax=Rotaria socialis TaxID=392032 RepID=A0A818KDJ6_9BILA|nr:unnamed protein product [Rotaria socialis]CAF4403068.1 unnamed protein product [Rotaria socialis]
MQQRLFLLMIFIKHQLVESQKISNSYGKVDLVFTYTRGKPFNFIKIPITTNLIQNSNANDAFILQLDQMKSALYNVERITCTEFSGSSGPCPKNFLSAYIFFQHYTIETHLIFKMRSDSSSLTRLLLNLSSITATNNGALNLTCFMPDSYALQYNNKPKDSFDTKLSATSLVGVIFLCSFVVLVFIFSGVWCATTYYRQFSQNRMEKKHRIALEKSTQQMLDKSPIITYDANSEDNDFTDKDPTCAICLESFKSKEKLRKIVCAHYFHVTCIDPWLLSHQSCPLCNRNILLNAIPSISSHIVMTDTEQTENPTASSMNNAANET